MLDVIAECKRAVGAGFGISRAVKSRICFCLGPSADLEDFGMRFTSIAMMLAKFLRSRPAALKVPETPTKSSFVNLLIPDKHFPSNISLGFAVGNLYSAAWGKSPFMGTRIPADR